MRSILLLWKQHEHVFNLGHQGIFYYGIKLDLKWRFAGTQKGTPMYETERELGTERIHGGCQREERWERHRTRSLGLSDQTYTYEMDKQLAPTVQYRELYSTPCDEPPWKILWRRMLRVCDWITLLYPRN